MQYVLWEDEITILPLPVRIVNVMKRNGVNTVGDMVRSTEGGKLKDFVYLGKKGVCEVEQWVKGLYTGADGYRITADKDKLTQREASNKNVEDTDSYLIQELSESYELTPAMCRGLINKTRNSYPEVKGETLIYRLYENEKLSNALDAKILSILEEHEGGVPQEILKGKIPKHLRNTTIVEEMLLSMEQRGEFRVEDDVYIRIFPSIIDSLNTIDERNRDIVLARLSGYKLQEIGDKYGITRERVRQICRKVLSSKRRRGRRFREDKYLYLFSKYDVSREDFMLAFDEPRSTYEYMDAIASRDPSTLEPFESVLEDENIPISMRRQAERAIYRNYIMVNGQHIQKKRSPLVDYYIRTYCRELTQFDDFEVKYQKFLDELGLSGDDNFKVIGHSGEAFLSKNQKRCLLWNQWRSFRYYDIQSRDYSDFLETINLMQYDGMEISTLKLFRDNAALMNEYDIRDEYELHNLLKKIWDETDSRVVFKRMPTIEIGSVNRDAQVWSLLLQYSPVSTGRLGELYEEAYGVKAPTFWGSYLKNFDKYFFNGVYSVDTQNLPNNEFTILSKLLTEDYYTIQEVQRIYLREFPNTDTTHINPYTLKTLGFRAYSNYVVRNTYTNSVDYFNKLLTGSDIVDMREYPASIQRIGTYQGEMRRLRQEREIVEFGPYQYINIRRLNQFGVTKETMEDYCRAVSQFVEKGSFFTVHSINSDGFSHSLDELGFDEVFYSAILMEDRAHFNYQRLGRERVFVNGKSNNVIADMLLWLIGEKHKIDIYDLRALLENHYGIVIDKYKLIDLIRNAGMYYDTIMETAYIDYDTYFEEI